MKSTECPNLDWPFVDAESDAEGPGHVRLKNTAIFFLRTLGFSIDQIETEYRYSDGWIDVAVPREDGSIVAVECETQEKISSGNVSNYQLARQGHLLYVVTASYIYHVSGHYSHHDKPLSVQLTLGCSGSPIGRWFADGRSYESADVPERRRWGTPLDDFHYEVEAPDEYNRWRANGEEKQESQPKHPMSQ